MTALIDLGLTTMYADPTSGLIVTRNVGTLGGAAVCGDGVTAGTIPALIGGGRRGIVCASGKYLKGPIIPSGTYSVVIMLNKTTALATNNFVFDFRSGGGAGYLYMAAGAPTVLSPSTGTVYVDGVASTTLPYGSVAVVAVTGITLAAPVLSAMFISSALAESWVGNIHNLAIHPGTLTPMQLRAIGEKWRSTLTLY
jgi:hypothetical protein